MPSIVSHRSIKIGPFSVNIQTRSTPNSAVAFGACSVLGPASVSPSVSVSLSAGWDSESEVSPSEELSSSMGSFESSSSPEESFESFSSCRCSSAAFLATVCLDLRPKQPLSAASEQNTRASTTSVSMAESFVERMYVSPP